MPTIKPEIVKASELNRAPGKVLRRVAVGKEHVVVESDGYPIVAMIAYPEYEQLMRLQAAQEMRAHMAELADISGKSGLDKVSDEEAIAHALKGAQEVRRSKRKKK